MDKNWVEQEDLTWQSPDSLLTSKKRKISQDAVYWVNMGRAQRKGLELFQTRSTAIILYITLPSICIERVMSWKTEENLYSRTKSPRPAPTMTLKNNWRQKENSGKDATSHEQPSQPSQLQSTGKPVAFKSQAEVDQQNMEDAQKNDEEIDQQSTVKPVLAFRVQRLLHSKVKEAEIGRVRVLISQTENHPNPKDLQEDLRQNNVYNPFSENSKKMVREMGNVKYFELCAPDPQVLSYCLTYWADGIVFCTCGICLTHTEETQRRNTKNFDLMSISNFVIWKRVGHGAQHGKSEEQHLCFKSYGARKRCRKHQDESGQKTLQASLTDSKEIQKIENRGKKLVGRRPYEKKWTRKHKKITLLRWQKRNIFDTNRIGAWHWTVQGRIVDRGFSTWFPRGSRIKKSPVQKIGRLSTANSTSRCRSIAKRQ